MKTPRLLLTIMALACAPAFAQLGANPRYIPEIQIGGGYAETVDGGMDIEKDGDFSTDGDGVIGGTLAITGAVTMTNDLALNGGDLTSTSATVNLSGSGTGVLRLSSNTARMLYTGADSYYHVLGDAYRGIFRAEAYLASNPRSELQLYSAAGTVSSPSDVIASNGPQGRIRASHYGGGGMRDSAYIDFYTDSGTISATSMPGEIRMLTSADGSIVPTLAFTINSDQSVVTAADLRSGDDVIVGDDVQGNTGVNLDLVPASGYGVRIYEDGGTVAAEFNTAGDLALGNYLTCADGIHVRLKPTTGEEIRLYEDGGAVSLAINTSGGIDTTGHIVSTVNGSYNLGSSSFRWNNAYVVSANTQGNSTFGDTSTDTNTFVGRMIVRSVTDAGPMTATNGTVAEIVWNTSDSKFYGCSVTGTPATWVALN